MPGDSVHGYGYDARFFVHVDIVDNLVTLKDIHLFSVYIQNGLSVFGGGILVDDVFVEEFFYAFSGMIIV